MLNGVRGWPVLVVALLGTGTARADEAETLYKRGQAAFDAGMYDEALKAWQDSYTRSQAPGLLFNLGQAFRLRGHPGDCALARDRYRRFLDLDPDSPQRDAAKSFADTMERCANEHVTLPLQLSPVHVQRWVGVGLGVAGVALVAAGVYTGRRASSIGDEVTQTCARLAGCDWAYESSRAAQGKRDQWLQYGFLGLGAAALATGAFLIWRDAQHARLSVAVSPHDARIGWSARW
jgi:hypothetical protein